MVEEASDGHSERAMLARKMAAGKAPASPSGLEAPLAGILNRVATPAPDAAPTSEGELGSAADALVSFWCQTATRCRDGQPFEKAEDVQPLFLNLVRRGYSVGEVQSAIQADPGQWSSQIKDHLPRQPGQPSPQMLKDRAEASRHKERRETLQTQIASAKERIAWAKAVEEGRQPWEGDPR